MAESRPKRPGLTATLVVGDVVVLARARLKRSDRPHRVDRLEHGSGPPGRMTAGLARVVQVELSRAAERSRQPVTTFVPSTLTATVASGAGDGPPVFLPVAS